MVRILILSLVCTLLLGCNRDIERERIEMIIERSGTNRAELERVLDHYKQSAGDTLKYRSACYLIANMWGHYSLDSTEFSIYQPFIKTRDSLLLAHGDCSPVTRKYLKEYDSLWGDYRERPSIRSFRGSIKSDIESITSNYLIDHIDRSFLIWERSPYRANIDFDSFCQYILPYRSFNGLWLEDGQDYFFSQQDKLLPKNISSDIRVTADSILQNYKHLTHNKFSAVGFPILGYKHILNNRTSTCLERCWLNRLILSSVGIPSAIDMVPFWSNKDNSHSWNVVLTADSSYACDAFWEDKGQWQYKRLYNNITEDRTWGALRLPKVFRYTYELIPGPISDKRVTSSNVPPFFRNYHQYDVSSEYFKTHNLNIKLQTPPPDNTYYAYLAVYNGGRWEAVQWGEIDKGYANFKGMGANSIYMPIYFTSHQTIPAGPPLLLSSDGTITYPKIDKSDLADIVIDRSAHLEPFQFDNIGYLYGVDIEHSTDKDFKNIVASRTILEQETILYYKHNVFSFEPHKSARFLRLSLKNTILNIGEIKFYSDSLEIEPTIIYSSLNIENDSLKNLTDGYMSTKIKVKDIDPNSSITFDFGTPVSLSHITICPGSSSNMKSKGAYTLLGWKDDNWEDLKSIYISEDNPEGNILRFKDVPQQGLYKITLPNSRKHRIFMYDKGDITWY